MGKNMTKKSAPTKKHKQPERKDARKVLPLRTLALLVAVGVAAMAGMALFNGGAKPNRDMKWFVGSRDVQVAAPPLGEGFAGGEREAPVGTARRLGIAPKQDEGPVTADITAEPTAEITRTPTEAPTENPTAEPLLAPSPTAGSVTLTITAVGDCTFGGEVGSRGRRNFLDLVEQNGYDYFFQNVRPLFSADDLTIANLEGPLTTATQPGKRGGFIFKGDPEYVNILSGSSVELCNLANNHTMDYGKLGLKDTMRTLSENGVGYCGYGEGFTADIKGVRVTALGFSWWTNDKDDIAKAVRAARDGCDLLIVNMHWGVEGHREQDARQTAIGHAIIDAGADLVIGTHPHVYQGIEKYKGKYIVYSLGNFCFAGNSNPGDKRCLVFQQTFSFNPGMGIVRANIMDAGINIIPCMVSSVQEVNDFQPVIMTPEEGTELLKAVATRSVNFTLADTLWMRDNYLVANGLLANGRPLTAEGVAEEGQTEEAQTEEAQTEEAAEAVPEFEGEAESPEDAVEL